MVLGELYASRKELAERPSTPSSNIGLWPEEQGTGRLLPPQGVGAAEEEEEGELRWVELRKPGFLGEEPNRMV